MANIKVTTFQGLSLYWDDRRSRSLYREPVGRKGKKGKKRGPRKF